MPYHPPNFALPAFFWKFPLHPFAQTSHRIPIFFEGQIWIRNAVSSYLIIIELRVEGGATKAGLVHAAAVEVARGNLVQRGVEGGVSVPWRVVVDPFLQWHSLNIYSVHMKMLILMLNHSVQLNDYFPLRKLQFIVFPSLFPIFFFVETFYALLLIIFSLP